MNRSELSEKENKNGASERANCISGTGSGSSVSEMVSVSDISGSKKGTVNGTFERENVNILETVHV